LKNEFPLSDLEDDQAVEGFGVKASILKEAKQKSGAAKVFVVVVDEEHFLVRRPKTDEHDRQIAAALTGGIKVAVESRNLARACVVYPDKASFGALIEELPGLGLSIAGELMKLTGASANAETKKY
jgi:hypothetical protein